VPLGRSAAAETASSGNATAAAYFCRCRRRRRKWRVTPRATGANAETGRPRSKLKLSCSCGPDGPKPSLPGRHRPGRRRSRTAGVQSEEEAPPPHVPRCGTVFRYRRRAQTLLRPWRPQRRRCRNPYSLRRCRRRSRQQQQTTTARLTQPEPLQAARPRPGPASPTLLPVVVRKCGFR
jgi:hypothetical protein